MADQETPRIRFQGFTEDWRKELLRNIALFNPKSAIPEEFEYVDLGSVIGTSLVAHRLEERESAPSRAKRVAHLGDIFYQTVRPYQQNNYLFDREEIRQYVFSTGYAQIRCQEDGPFLFSALQRSEFVREVTSRCTGTSYPAISPNDLSEIEIRIPGSLDEQRRIGVIQSEFDTLLNATSKEIEKLKHLKTTMLTKMFPQGDSRVPEIRFSGFQDDWKERDFNSFFKFGRSFPVTRANLNEKVGNGLSVHYGDILTSLPNLVDVSSQKLPFINDPELVSRLFGKQLLNGDVVMADTAEDESVGQCVELRISGELPVFGGLHTYVLRPLIACAEGFLGVLMNSALVHSQIVHFSQGTKVTSVSKEALSGLSLLTPSLTEQESISNFFRELDTLISSEAEKLEKLRHLKSAFLQSMFV